MDKCFTNIHQTKHVTPYMHILAMHVPEFLNIYTARIRKINDQITIDFARNINHNYRNLNALKQLMQKKIE